MSTEGKGILAVISGFSGAGKGTLMKRLLSEYGNDYALSVSATTRAPRPGEEDGRDYFFVSKERFEQMIAGNELIEYACYVGNYYGTPRSYVEEQLAAGRNVILEIEIQGAQKIRRQFPDTRLLFVTAPGAEELRNRLAGRGTESAEVIGQRLKRAYEESAEMKQYDYLIVNDDLEQAVSLIHTIITNEQNGNAKENAASLVSANAGLIDRMQNELFSFSKGE